MDDPRTDLDARLEAEIQAALGDQSIEELLAESDRPGGRGTAPARSGRSLRKGTVVSVHGEDVLVEFGPKTQGVCPLNQFDEPPTPGDSLEFMVERHDADEGLLILSRKGAVAKAAWESLQVGQVVEARCTGTNKGGLEMEVAKHRAFMPAGQVDIRHVDDLDEFINQKLTCEVIELDRHKGRLVLSRKAHLERERAQQREAILANLDVGDEVQGTVSSIQPYGAFIDLGGVDGLAHISDLSYKRIHDPSEVVKVGDQVTVKVLRLETDDDDAPRISLGLKQTMADPFQSRAGELQEGATVTGRVTNTTNYGAFVEIAPGVEGLIHISELSHDHVKRVEAVVKKDEIVTAKILSVDTSRQRIALSLKALKQAQAEQQPRTVDSSVEKLKARFSSDWEDLKGGLG